MSRSDDRCSAGSCDLPEWEDPRVQTVYELLCADLEPPHSQHWEGFVARHIVRALIPDVAQATIDPARAVLGRAKAIIEAAAQGRPVSMAAGYILSAVNAALAAQPPAAPVEMCPRCNGATVIPIRLSSEESVLAAEVCQEEPATRNTAALLAQGVEGPHPHSSAGSLSETERDELATRFLMQMMDCDKAQVQQWAKEFDRKWLATVGFIVKHAPKQHTGAVEATEAREAIARMLVPYYYGGFERQDRNERGHWEFPPGTPNERAYEIADKALAIIAARTANVPQGAQETSKGLFSLKALGSRLAELLDADHWNNVEPFLLDIEAALDRRSFYADSSREYLVEQATKLTEALEERNREISALVRRESLVDRLIELSPVGSFRLTPYWEERERLMDQLRSLSLSRPQSGGDNG